MSTTPTQKCGVPLFISHLPVKIGDIGFDPLPAKSINFDQSRGDWWNIFLLVRLIGVQ